MKVKNIVFSGFAAAILMGTVSANAATPFKIASQAYVDTEIAKLSGANGAITDVAGDVTTLQNIVNGTGNEDGLVDRVGDLETTVNTATTGLTDRVEALEATVDTATTGLSDRMTAAENDIDSLQDTVGTGTMSVGGAAQTDVIAAINALDTKTNGIATAGNLSQLETTVGTKQNRSDSTVPELQSGNYNHISDGYAVGTNLVALDTALGTAEGEIDALQEAVGTLPANTNIADALADKQDKIDSTHMLDADSVDDTNSTHKFVTASDKQTWNDKQDALTQTQQDALTAAANLLAAGYNTCITKQGGSGHCVLTADANGLTWTDVTNPFEIE